MTEWHPLRSLHDGEEPSELSRLWKELDQSAEEVGRTIANASPATMPTLDHSSMVDYYNVYEPSDDTYLLIDAIKYDLFSECPSDTSGGCGGGEDSEEESVERAALECYSRCPQIKSDSSGRDTDRDGAEEDRTIVENLAETKGYSADRTDRILSRLRQLRRLQRIQTVMEIGTGSGVPITYLAKRLLAEKPWPPQSSDDIGGFSVIATDLNPLALEFARKTAEENGVIVADASDKSGETKSSSNNSKTAKIRSIDFVECDLATPLLDDREGAIDVLVFNPPYVPTEDSEIDGTGIEISWAGGTDGRIVIDRALTQIARLLRKPDGVCYMITVDDNRPSQLASVLQKDYGLHMVPLVRRRARNEYLSVQKISWPAAP